MARGPEPALAPVETGAHSVMRGLRRATDRVTLVSVSQVAEDLGQGVLVRLALPLPESERPIGIATRAGWIPGLPQARFIGILRGVAADHADGEAGDADRVHRFRRGGGRLRGGLGQPAGSVRL